MPRPFPRRLAVWVAVICLALMIVALGAAAKHSQFESISHSTSFLAQSVKMVSGETCSLVPEAAVPTTEPLLQVEIVPLWHVAPVVCRVSIPFVPLIV